jgi:integrase
LGDVAYGRDPALDKRSKRDAISVAELCDIYMSEAGAGRLIGRRGEPKRASTVAVDKGMIEGHIKPLIGSRSVASVTRRDIEQFMHDIAAGKTASTRKTRPRGVSRLKGGRGAATRTTGLLGSVFTYAVASGFIENSPTRGVRRFADGRRERRLNDEEYAALGKALDQAQATMWPPAVACMRFLSLTGWRSGEARTLHWRDVDLARRVVILPDTKSGRSVRPLSNAACDLLRRIDRAGDDALVFPASRGEGQIAIKKYASRIMAPAELAGVTAHTLRHSFASVAADLELSELTIAALLGHRKATVTSKYAHHTDATLLQAADRVAGRIASLMGEASAGAKVVELRKSVNQLA